MRKYIAKLSLITLGFVLAGAAILPTPANAGFNSNRIMADSVFNNSGTLNTSQIDAFLNSFSSSCISTNNGFSSPDVVGYNPSQGFLYGSNVSAGTVINNAAKAYDLNPQVILATLQKEQSLVSGSAGCHYETPPTQEPCPNPPYGTHTSCVVACQYPGGCVYIAMGYDCPQYCVPNSTGFSKQIIKAAWKLKFVQERSLGNYNWDVQKPGWDNSDDPITDYNGYMTQGTLKRNASSTPANYDGFRPVNNNSLTVHLDTGATASLYSYTPFTSGNQNFVSIFESWFGPTVPVNLTGSPASVSWGSSRIDAFARGSDGGLWQKWFDDSDGWRAWGSLNVPISSTPTVSSWGSGRLDVLYLNDASELGHYWFDGTAWQGPESLGKLPSNLTLTGSPTAISWGPNRVDVFARGSDGGLWQKWFDASGGWRPWNKLGGAITSAPSVSSWQSGRLDIFGNGPGGDLQHYWFDDTGWHGWESLGFPSGGLTTPIAPTAISWGPNRVDVFSRGNDGAIWQKWFDASGGWRPWNKLGGAITSAPSVSSWQSGRLDIFGMGNPGDLQHYWFDDTGWHGWESLGSPN